MDRTECWTTEKKIRMLSKQEIYDLLNEKGIRHEVTFIG